jgi:hypothetical protein
MNLNHGDVISKQQGREGRCPGREEEQQQQQEEEQRKKSSFWTGGIK